MTKTNIHSLKDKILYLNGMKKLEKNISEVSSTFHNNERRQICK